MEPAAGEKLHEEHEHDNTVDKFAVKVVKNSEKVGHLPHEYLQNFVIKSQWTTATRSQFLSCLFRDILRSFMNIN